MSFVLYAVFVCLYLFIGNVIAAISIECWKTETRVNIFSNIYMPSYELQKKPTISFFLFFPYTAIHGKSDNFGAFVSTHSAYRLFMLVIWPLKMLINIVIVLCYSLWMLPWLLDAITNKCIGVAKSRRLASIKSHRSKTYGQELEELRAGRDTAQNEVERLNAKIIIVEQEMLESQGGNIYRVSESIERRPT